MGDEIPLGACSVERAGRAIGDAWSYLILRESLFFGVTRFEDFRARLTIARGPLSARLQQLSKAGILERRPLVPGARRLGYEPTRTGRGLLPALIAALNWGDRWCAGPEGPPMHLVHTSCGRRLGAAVVCAACREVVRAREVRFSRGPGARAWRPRRQHRSRMPNLALLERGGPCSIARTMTVIGDHWSVLLIRECFYGIRRFGEFQRRLGVATNILTERLNRLVEAEVLYRRAVDAGRNEYHLTEKGLDLYALPVSTLLWGDRWLAGKNGPPVRLVHACGRRLKTRLECQQCAGSVQVSNISAGRRTVRPTARGKES